MLPVAPQASRCKSGASSKQSWAPSGLPWASLCFLSSSSFLAADQYVLSVCLCLSLFLSLSVSPSLSVCLSLSLLFACLLRGLGTSRWPEGRPPPRSAVVRGEAPIRGGEFVPLSVPVETPPNNTPPEPSRLKPRLGSTQLIRDSQKSQLCTATPSSLDQDDSSGVKLGSSLS